MEMKLRDVICILDTDLFYVHIGVKDHSKTEHIETSANRNWKEIKKYYDYEVVKVWCEEYGMGILLKQQ